MLIPPWTLKDELSRFKRASAYHVNLTCPPAMKSNLPDAMNPAAKEITIQMNLRRFDSGERLATGPLEVVLVTVFSIQEGIDLQMELSPKLGPSQAKYAVEKPSAVSRRSP